MPRLVDWLLVGRYALLVSLTLFIPLPLVDAWTGDALRRRFVRALAEQHGVELPREQIQRLADAEGGGCVGLLLAVLCWPVKKLLKTVFFVLLVKDVVDEASATLHRGLMLHDALAIGVLPGDAEAVRGAMDRSLEKIDTRVLERVLLGVFKDNKDALNRVIHEASRVARQADRSRRGAALADAADADDLGEAADELSEAMAAAVRGTGVVPELILRFHHELGEAGLAGELP